MKSNDLRLGGGVRRSALSVLVVSLWLCGTVAAQSGRRVQRGAQPGVNQVQAPIIVPEPAAAKTPTRPLPDVAVLVAGRIDGKAQSARAETIFNKCVARLAGSMMKVTSLGLVRRDEALRRAKEEPEAYVVWLELERDSVQGGRILFNSPHIAVRFQIIDPRTGESKGKGKVYYQAQGGGGSRRDEPGDTTVRITPEAAGEEAAEQVLDWFSVLATSQRKS